MNGINILLLKPNKQSLLLTLFYHHQYLFISCEHIMEENKISLTNFEGFSF